MVMPIWDHSPFKWPKPPYVMWALIVINFAVFFIEAGFWPDQMDQLDRLAGLVPAALTGSAPAAGLPAPLTLITCMFVHGNFMHVFGNMIFLFVFGDDIEEALGHWRFLGFYLACGIGSGLAFVASDPSSTTGLIGASGAVAGVDSRVSAVPAVRQGHLPARPHSAAAAGLLDHRRLGDLAVRRCREPHRRRHRLLGACRRSDHRRRPVRGDAAGGGSAVRMHRNRAPLRPKVTSIS